VERKRQVIEQMKAGTYTLPDPLQVADAMIADPRFRKKVEFVSDTRRTPPIIRCNHCGLRKREYEFSDNPAKRNLRNSWCRECSRVEHDHCAVDHLAEFWNWLAKILADRPSLNLWAYAGREVD
jgi:hypothetical protein